MIQEWIQMNLKRNAEVAKTFVKNLDSWEGVYVFKGWGHDPLTLPMQSYDTVANSLWSLSPVSTLLL